MKIKAFGILFLLFIVPETSAQRPQESGASGTQDKATYFLIDASGSMVGKNAEGLVSKILDPLIAGNPQAPVSRTYFRAKDGNACWNPVKIGNIGPAIDSLAQTVEYEDDYTPLGEALKAALLSAVSRGGPADIYIISDEDPTPRCGIDICDVANAYLPLPGIAVKSMQVDESAPARRDRLGCIDAAEARPVAGANLGTSQTESRASSVTSWSLWKSAGWWERWSWLAIFTFAVLSASAFTRRVVLKAHAYEKRSEEIQERQRALLTGQGDEEKHKQQISILCDFDDPEPRGWRLTGWFLAALALIFTMILMFTEHRFLWIWKLDEYDRLGFVELDTARKLAWLVLSSGFSNAFAIIGITPILFMSAQNWRYIQSKRTFSYVSGNAAEEEARKRNQEIEDLFVELKSVRSAIPSSSIATPWADVPKQYPWRTVPDKYTDEDRTFLVEVKRRLLEFAQGPTPSKEGKNRSTLAAQLVELSAYAPRSRWFAPWTMEAMIRDLKKRGWINSQAERWILLAEQIEDRKHREISVSLKTLASYSASEG